MTTYDSKESDIKTIMDECLQWKEPNGKRIKIGGLFYMYIEKRFFFFRIFEGYGIWGRSEKEKRFELFSERYGYTKYLRIFGWKFKTLKPSKKC